MVEDHSDPYEYEVDLREYIQVIWQEKWIILAIFLIAAGAAYGFIKTRPPQYETQTTLLITPRVSEQLENGGEGLSSNLPTSMYEKSAMANDLLRGIIDDLDENEDGGQDLTVKSLENKLSLEIVLSEDQGGQSSQLPILTMTVTGDDPEVVQEIANKWADLFVEKNTELLSSETARSFDFISGRFEEVDDQLTSREQEKLDYKEQNPLEVLKSEVKVLQWKYEESLSSLETKRAELRGKKARLGSLESSLKEEPEFLNLERSISEENLWALLRELRSDSEVNDEDSDEEQINRLKGWEGFRVSDQEINEVYFNLLEEKRNIQADISSLEEEIGYLEDKTKDLATEIEEKQFRIDQTELKLKQLDREISRLKNTYNTLSDDLEEARIANQEEESSIRIMERAVTPEAPVATNTRQNVAVAGVLGLFIGVLVAFFKNYMQDYELEEAEEEEDPEPED